MGSAAVMAVTASISDSETRRKNPAISANDIPRSSESFKKIRSALAHGSPLSAQLGSVMLHRFRPDAGWPKDPPAAITVFVLFSVAIEKANRMASKAG
jgi:hypothetical protein